MPVFVPSQKTLSPLRCDGVSVLTALRMVAQLAVKLHPDKWYGV